MKSELHLSSAGEPHIVEVKIIKDARGTLGIIEGLKEVGFDFRRIYFMTDLACASNRGGHAHKRLKQCFVVMRGAVTIKLEGLGRVHEFRLENCDKALVVPAGYWRDLYDFSEDCLIAVLASDYYEEDDYIRDYAEFLAYSMPSAVNRVPYIDLGRHVSDMRADLQAAVDRTFDSGTFIGGSLVEEFETSFARYSEAEKAVGVANGYDALELTLRAWNICAGDEVIVPAHTFVATALAVARTGASPVLVDVEQDTAVIDVSKVEAAITPKTKAIIPVHLYGHPVDMDPLMAIAERHGLWVLEDAAQAHGARYKGRRCGSLGHAAAFSFYPTKNLGAFGDGGGVTSNDAALVAKVKQLGNYGASRKYHHNDLGINSRLDPMQAALLSVTLKRLDAWNGRRDELARRYLDGLHGIEGLRLPAVRNWAEPVWHVFAIQVLDGRRVDLEAWLQAASIGTNIHYPLPIHHQKCFAYLGYDPKGFPIAENLAQTVLSLPLDALHSDAEIDYVIEKTCDFFRR
ncbi:DegT/DnrJ/EryC1/StrS family aminotransferase [Rhizobium sp. AQ_MP]|uniref:aminotransferase class I/II-fold pyridoxal phosphate-dependent enzyme n=1 Tax=Rhizobium sp. AQ_MP TaxID=2761536 RepID=UPI00163B179A|nr:aminotransferase class I/II-fold pyridoxal phosphate-dependent enzyme [Rhizobium sp. AQ_MP]MBC2774695.1 DegT/DnrJ/EryC1/StrS family aminotransferase [Rhizobium sp. AQ_MP]